MVISIVGEAVRVGLGVRVGFGVSVGSEICVLPPEQAASKNQPAMPISTIQVKKNFLIPDIPGGSLSL
jgi:hypothetical protein